MTLHQKFNPDLTRRSWIVLATSALTGCGGGGGDGIAGAPGTGGTGIYQGAISGFGSVIVNGVTYDNAQAVMRLNDTVVSQTSLRLGMVATVRGDRVAGTTLGTASSIDVWTIAQGVVSEVETVVVSDVKTGKFIVSGMTILTTAATWFYGLTPDTPLSDGQYVSVWGLQADADGHTWAASCVLASTPTADAVSSGRVKFDDGEPTLNGILLTGTVANSLVDEALTRVQGTWASNGSLNVVSATTIDSALGVQPEGEVEIEGLVTTVPTASGFMLGSIAVDTTTSMVSPVGALIAVGSRVEVYGSWQGGVLKATKVELEDQEPPGTIEITAPFQQFTSLADFVLQGQRCDATGVLLSQATSAALSTVGAIFKVKGVKSGDWLKVSEMELDD